MILGLGLLASAALAPGQSPLPLAATNGVGEVSYALGVIFGTGLKKEGFEIDSAQIELAIREAFSGATNARMGFGKAQELVGAYRAELAKRPERLRELLADQNEMTGAAFLEANAKVEGVISLPSGVQYKVLTAGSGSKPATNDVLLLNQRGTRIDGTEFLNQKRKKLWLDRSHVVDGVREALLLMPKGSKWQVFVPSRHAYHRRDLREIPQFRLEPGSTLIYEVELLDVTPLEVQLGSFRQAQLEGNQSASAQLLAENSRKPGVTTLASGLQYEILKPGEGPLPKPEDTALIRYTGTNFHGKRFHSSGSDPESIKLGQPAEKLIPGLHEALRLMPKGSIWKLTVPASLAYGDEGLPPKVEPGQFVTIEVELVGLVSARGDSE